MTNRTAKFDRVQTLAHGLGYDVQYKPTRQLRGWPVASTKPYQLSFGTSHSGTHLASFATLEALETNLRGRAGC